MDIEDAIRILSRLKSKVWESWTRPAKFYLSFEEKRAIDIVIDKIKKNEQNKKNTINIIE